MKRFLRNISIGLIVLLALPFTVNASGKVGSSLSNSIPIYVPAPAQYNEVECGVTGMETITHFTHWQDPSRRTYRFLFQASGGSTDGVVTFNVQFESFETVSIPAGSSLTNYSVELTSIYTDERPIDSFIQASAGTCTGGSEYPMIVRNLNLQIKP